MNKTIPALFEVRQDQPDDRQLAITVYLLHEGACFGKLLFCSTAIDAIAATLPNVSIAADDDSGAVGVVPEDAAPEWIKMYLGGKVRNYCRIDALLWKRQENYLPSYPLKTGQYYNIEVDLTNIEGEPQEDGNTAVKSATVSTLRLVDQPITLFTVQSARYGTLPKK